MTMPGTNAQQPTPESTADIHKVADTDSSSTAAHHTLGVQPNQASPGDHIHDGRTSKDLYIARSVTGSRGGNAAVASLLTQLALQGLIIDNTTA